MPPARQGLPLWLIVVLGGAGTTVALWGLHVAAPILGPVLLAFVLTVAVHPLTGGLVRRGPPAGSPSPSRSSWSTAG